MRDEVQDRLGLEKTGDSMEDLLKEVCENYGIGEYRDHSFLSKGYEDVNFATKTSDGKFLVKVFNSDRNAKECQRYANIMQEAVKNGIQHPSLHSHSREAVFSAEVDGQDIRLCVMDFIEGATLMEQDYRLMEGDIRFLARQAARINSLGVKPPGGEDSWAITNFRQKLEDTRKYLSDKELELLEPLEQEFLDTDIESLPHCFVHGDIRATNVMKDEEGDLWILDFSVSGNYPRIQELAVIASNLLENTQEELDILLDEYQKHHELTEKELAKLSLFIQVSHAMNFLGAKYEKEANGVASEENEYWLRKGREGLTIT